MELAAKLAILADAAKYDASCASGGGKAQGLRTAGAGGLGDTRQMGICHSYTPDGRCVALLKILLTNFCLFDCKYCVNRISSDTPRARFTTREVVGLTLDFYRRNYIEGLFLSSGIIRSPDYTMEQLIAVARSLREDHQYAGYIHLKSIPGAADDLIQEAGRYADRLSINIELPTAQDLATLAPDKQRPALEANMRRIKVAIDHQRDEAKVFKHVPRFAPGGQSTQMIVGATPTSDRTILTTAHQLYQNYGLRRVYYSAFSPIPHADSRLPLAPPPLAREHRLYQSDWLLRFYGYTVEEILPASHPDLPLDLDPKVAYALRNPGLFPLDVNRAPRAMLLRVPGFGVQGVQRILAARRHRKLTLADLARLHLPLARAKPFILTADANPTAHLLQRANGVELVRRLLVPPTQLSLGL